MKFNLLTLSFVALAQCYSVNNCRDFSGKVIQDFSFDDFSGEWFPIYRSKGSLRLMGRCPVWYFDNYEPPTETQAKRLNGLTGDQENFRLTRSYKGMAGIVDNVSKYMGYLDKGTSNGSIYTGVTLRPLKQFKDNFQILSTDYENYAIVYTCTFKSAMYNRDDFTVLVRNLEDKPELLETIKEEFLRLFDDQTDEEPE